MIKMYLNFNKANNRNGFSLISTMISVGIFSIVSLGILYAIASSMDALKHFKNFEDVSNNVEMVSGLLSDPNYCGLHFNDLEIPSSMKKDDLIKDSIVIKDLDIDNKLNSPLFESGTQISPGLSLQSLRLVTMKPISSNRILGEVVLKYSASSGMLKTFERRVPLFLSVTVVSGQTLIDGCSKRNELLGYSPTEGSDSLKPNGIFTAEDLVEEASNRELKAAVQVKVLTAPALKSRVCNASFSDAYNVKMEKITGIMVTKSKDIKITDGYRKGDILCNLGKNGRCSAKFLYIEHQAGAVIGYCTGKSYANLFSKEGDIVFEVGSDGLRVSGALEGKDYDDVDDTGTKTFSWYK